MKILSFIEDPEIIKKILKHLDLWDLKDRLPPKRAKVPPPTAHIDDSHRGVGPYGLEADSQVPPCEDYLCKDPDYPVEAYSHAQARVVAS